MITTLQPLESFLSKVGARRRKARSWWPSTGGCRTLGGRAFAGTLGVAPVTEIPILAVFGLLAALILAGNLLAALPAAVAARTQPAVTLRTE
jgi:hypothetical protein